MAVNENVCLRVQEGHKWLQSVHRFNEQQKPAIMAWATVSYNVTMPYLPFICQSVIHSWESGYKCPISTPNNLITISLCFYQALL